MNEFEEKDRLIETILNKVFSEMRSAERQAFVTQAGLRILSLAQLTNILNEDLAGVRREKELLQKLSEAYKHKEDPYGSFPSTLCLGTFRDFYLEEYTLTDIRRLQVELFEICHRRGEAWTR